MAILSPALGSADEGAWAACPPKPSRVGAGERAAIAATAIVRNRQVVFVVISSMRSIDASLSSARSVREHVMSIEIVS